MGFCGHVFCEDVGDYADAWRWCVLVVLVMDLDDADTEVVVDGDAFDDAGDGVGDVDRCR